MQLSSKIQHILQGLQFSETEIAFYMAVLRQPGSTIYKLSKLIGVSKNKAYDIFANLESRGLVASSSEGWRKEVIPKSLNGLAENMKRQSRNLGKMADSLKNINQYLPLLNEQHDARIKHLGDIDEIRGGYTELLDGAGDHILAYGGFETFVKDMGLDQERAFIDKRGLHAQRLAEFQCRLCGLLIYC